MMRKGTICLLALIGIFNFVWQCESTVPNTPGFSISEVANYTLLSTTNSSSLYSITLQQDDYQFPIYLIDLWGDRYTIGYDYGFLLATQIEKNYDAVMNSIVEESGMGWAIDQLLKDILAAFLDWQWSDYLSLQLPSEYNEELQGMSQGGIDAGKKDTLAYITRALVLANIPSDIIDLRYILKQEYEQWKSSSSFPHDQTFFHHNLLHAIKGGPRGLQCSMFAVWGLRSLDGQLYSARNLDYMPDMGIDEYKLITIWHPNDGAYEHASFGYSGMYGALTGVSAMGVSVHEANLEVNQETFEGFPWLLRLRYIMENTLHISDAWSLWEQTNNTVGFNHMVTSAYDAKEYGTYAALVMETMADYTAYFQDNDPREKFATYFDTETNTTYPFGFPLPNALWRTNHGYDPKIREHYMWNGMSAGNWSMERYMFAYEGFTYYEQQHIEIGTIEAINITSILGDKGHHAYQCYDNNDGTNILSVTYHPISQNLWAAWENGSGSAWRPAACNTYAHIDLSKWFTTAP